MAQVPELSNEEQLLLRKATIITINQVLQDNLNDSYPDEYYEEPDESSPF